MTTARGASVDARECGDARDANGVSSESRGRGILSARARRRGRTTARATRNARWVDLSVGIYNELPQLIIRRFEPLRRSSKQNLWKKSYTGMEARPEPPPSPNSFGTQKNHEDFFLDTL